MRGGAVAARRAHNPKVAGSSPAPATDEDHDTVMIFMLFNAFERRAEPCLPFAARSRVYSGGNPHAFVHGDFGERFS